MAERKSEVIITVNHNQAQKALDVMQEKLKRLQNSLNAMQDKTSEKAKQVQKEIKDIKAVIGELSGNIEKVDKVLNNLSGSSLRQLNAALRQVKKEMSRVSSDSPKLDELRQKYKAITDQIKILQGETLNIKKHIGELSQVSDNWLSKAINQQKTLVGSLSKTDQAYQSQLNTLHRLQEEQARRAVSTINDGGASADALRTARANLVSYRDALGSGGIMPASGNVAAEIEQINKKLKECDAQLDKINGKEQQVEMTTQQIQQKADQIILDPKKFSPKEIKAAIDEIQKKLQTLGSGDTNRKRLNEQMKQLQNILAGVDRELVDVGRLLQPGNLKKASLETLQKAARQLEEELRKMDRSQTAYINKSKQLAMVRAEIDRGTQAVRQQSSAWQTTIRNITTYFGLFQLVTMVISKLKEIVKLNLQMSDQLADIRKVSGLAMEEINQLNINLAKIDTRTTIQELNKIAYAGAKLGIGKWGTEGLEQFTRAANKVNVALKEDLGADALTALSKITEVMGLIPKMGIEKSMLATGSAMFQLAATSTATSNNIVEFSKRLTGMARTAGITTDQLLALGSAADSMYLMPEVASTAFNKFITALQKNHNLIEKSLEIEPGTISQLYSAGRIVDAMVLVFEKMRDKGNMNVMQDLFKDLDSDGARLVNVMVTMSKNVDMLKDHLYTSAEAFEEATAVTNEYNIQQETANALMERAANAWEKAFINPQGVDYVKSMAEQWYNLSMALSTSNWYMGQMKLTLLLLWSIVKVGLALLPMLLQYLMFAGAYKAVMGLVAGFKALRTAIAASMAAQQGLNLAMKANIFGVIASLIAGALVYFLDYGKAVDDAADSTRSLKEYTDEAAAAFDNEKRKLDSYLAVLNDANTSQEQRERILKRFNHEYQPYLTKLGMEVKSVNDLQGAYEALNAEIKKKMYYQLRERAYTDKLGEAAGGVENATLNYSKYVNRTGSDFSAFDTKWLQSQVDAGQNTEQIYRSMMEAVYGKGGVWSGYNGDYIINNKSKRDSGLKARIEEFIKSNQNYTSTKKEIDDAFNPIIGDYDPFKDDDLGELERDAVDKAALKKQRAEEAARRKALRAQMKEENEKAKAIIDNVKNYYERQIAAITEMATRTGMSEEWQKKMTDGMTQRMNSALSEVRKAIAGTENEWAAFRQTMIDDLYEPLGDDGRNQSTDLLDNIIHNDIEKLKQMITVLSKELGQNGSVLLDQIWRKATENQLANARKENKAYQARQQLLLEKNYTGKVNRDYENQMEQLGVSDLTAEQTAQLMGWSQEGNQEAIQQFVNERSQQWQSALYNAREHIVEVLAADSPESLFDVIFPDWQDNIGQNNVLGDLFDVKDVLDENGQIIGQRLKLEDDRFKAFFQKLIEYSDAYTDAQKKAYDEAKRRADFVFNNRQDIQQLDTQTGQLSDINRDQQRFESDKNFSQQMGMSWNMDQDPEILRYRMLAERAKLYFAEMKRLRAEDKISAEQLNEAQRQMMDAQADMADRIASKFHERVQLLQQFSEPIATFAEGVGEYLGNLVSDTEDSSIKLKDLAKNMLKAYAKMTIQLMAEDLTRRVIKQLYQRQEEADETTHQMTLLTIQQTFAAMMLAAQTTSDTARLTEHSAANATELSEEAASTSAKVPLGIAGGAAKIIGTLGFWGIPLIAVISALLMGLLSWAISAAFGGSDNSGSDSGQNVKLATGMLTYDSGNAQSFSHPSRPGSPASSGSPAGETSPVLGNDGKVYNARQVPQLETGIVRSPIATLVNGQPSLVAEKGPEMVIGRETTHAMQMNRPDLINEIVKFDKNHSAGAGYRMYDEGNLDELGIDGMTGDAANGGMGITSEDIKSFRDSISDFTAMMLLLQKNGLHVNKYGRGGVTQESQDGANFMRRNSGDRLWKK